jgi:TolA-binding protein
MNTIHGRKLIGCMMSIMIVALFCSKAALADVKGTITTKTGKKLPGLIHWQASAKVYTIGMGGTTEMTVPLDQVADINVEKPAALDGAISKVQGGQYAAAVSTLEQIARDYAMLQYDVIGTRWLAEAYLKMGDPSKAAAVCDKLLRDNPNAIVSGDLAYNFWEALLKTKQYSKLEQALTASIQKGPREVAAVAQLKRGDMEKEKGNIKEALLDGYLRTVCLFQAVKSVQPEALYKAAKCFEELNQIANAEKMRKRLLTEFPQDPYSEKLKAGT